MKASRIEYGGSERLRLRNVELHDPGPDEVHVKLRAAGLNFELEAGKISRESDYWDAVTFMRQVGRLPSP